MSLKKQIQTQIVDAVETVKETNPMAGSVTNSVTINFVANAQLAVGGAAAMVYLPDEAQFLAQAGGASERFFRTYPATRWCSCSEMPHFTDICRPWPTRNPFSLNHRPVRPAGVVDPSRRLNLSEPARLNPKT